MTVDLNQYEFIGHGGLLNAKSDDWSRFKSNLFIEIFAETSLTIFDSTNSFNIKLPIPST